MIFKEVVNSLGEYDLTVPKLLNVIFRLQQNSYSEKKNDSHFGNKTAPELPERTKNKKQKNPHLERKAKLNGCFSISL